MIDSLASPPPQGKILPIETSMLICNDHRSNALTYIRHLVSIGPDNALWVNKCHFAKKG